MIARFRFASAPDDACVCLKLLRRGGESMGELHVAAEIKALWEEFDYGPLDSEALALNLALSRAVLVAATCNCGLILVGDRAAWPQAWGTLYQPH